MLCGGPEAIAPRAGRSIWAIYKWFGNGIPEKHWGLVMELSNVTIDEIYRANQAARFRNNEQVAVA